MVLRASENSLGPLLGTLGGLLEASCTPYECYLGSLGVLLQSLGTLFGLLGSSLGTPWELLGFLGVLLEHLGTIVGRLGSCLGDPLEPLDLLLGALAALLGSSWSHLGPLEAACEARVRRSTVG